MKSMNVLLYIKGNDKKLTALAGLAGAIFYACTNSAQKCANFTPGCLRRKSDKAIGNGYFLSKMSECVFDLYAPKAAGDGC